MEWNVMWFVGSLAGGLLASAIGVEWVRGSRQKSDPEQQQQEQQKKEERLHRLEQLARATRSYCPSCDFQRTKDLQRRALEAEAATRRRSARSARIRASFALRGASARNA